jgi:predicted nucleotidyltransferase
MDQTRLIAKLKRYDPALHQNGATGVYIYCSSARGYLHPDSDIALFINYDSDARVPNILRLMQIEDDISQGLGVPATITTGLPCTRG